MFHFLRLWRLQRRHQIYRYFNGRSWVWADPLVLQRKLDEAGGTGWGHHLEVLQLAHLAAGKLKSESLLKEQSKSVSESTEALIAMVRKAFDAPPIDPSGYGVTEAGCIGILGDFLGWMMQAEADARPSLSSPPPTEPSPSPGAAANSTTE